jgi:hypothetical protein
MAHAALPKHVSPTRAAILLGRSRRRVEVLIADGLLAAEGRVHKRIPLSAIEAYRGRAITIAEWTNSETRYDRTRETQRHYNINRRVEPADKESSLSACPA